MRYLQSKHLCRTYILKTVLLVVQFSSPLPRCRHSYSVESHATRALNLINNCFLLLLLNLRKGKDLASSPFLLTSSISSTSSLNLSCVGPCVYFIQSTILSMISLSASTLISAFNNL
jgi:hypothetical protein